MSSYSSFFSSGLLAPPVTIYSRKDLPMHVSPDDEEMVGASPRVNGLSPAAPSSPMAIPDDSDTEFNISDRVVTPTREHRSRTLSYTSGRKIELSPIRVDMDIGASAGSHTSHNQRTPRSPSQPPSGRRLRRRRSSLAGSTSPMCAIKSASRSIGHALELQKLLRSPIRSRKNSLSLAAAATDMLAGNGTNTEQNTLLTRLRSGSTSSYRRRTLRRVSMVPPAPPPSAPLPELPPSFADTPLCRFLPTPQTAVPIVNWAPLAQKTVLSPKDTSPTMFRRRDRSYSVNTDYRIDELKEN
ncbi:hypothetical protein AX14_006557 [Amanita brunnescens Koide BX004]|nr:hypothetical protein AX14_012273 [Amanita brunnescens Koide BX004]KAF8728500.1 hypothetical protein AX14_006557 [Amanita brunnescens Koide BX004]